MVNHAGERAHFCQYVRQPLRLRSGSVPDPLLNPALILFHHIIQMLALAQLNSAREKTVSLQRFHRPRISGVLVHVDHTGDGIAGSAQSLPEEALGPRSVSFGGEQELNRLAGRVHRAI